MGLRRCGSGIRTGSMVRWVGKEVVAESSKRMHSERNIEDATRIAHLSARKSF